MSKLLRQNIIRIIEEFKINPGYEKYGFKKWKYNAAFPQYLLEIADYVSWILTFKKGRGYSQKEVRMFVLD